MGTNPFRKRFYFKFYLRVLSLANPLILLGFAAFLGLISVSIINGSKNLQVFQYLFIFFILIIDIVVLACAVISIVGHTLPILLSHLDVSEQGLEYNYWPTYHIRCTWDDVESITKRREVIKTDIILLRQATELGKPITMKLRKKLGMDTQYFIPLNVLDGWPRGKLQELLEQNVPWVFNHESTN